MSREVIHVVAGSALLLTAPVVQIARENLLFMIWSDFWPTLLVVVGPPVLATLILAVIFSTRLGIAASVAIWLWLSTYHIELDAWLHGLDSAALRGTTAIELLLWFAPVLLFVLSLLPRKLIASTVGTVGAALFVLAAVQLALSKDLAQFTSPAVAAASQIDGRPLPEPGQTAARLPDIIYIVPDRYGNSGVLSRFFDHDNSAFSDELERRGFFVADQARSNYLQTHLSLSSSMNMQYIEQLLRALNGKTNSNRPIYSLIQNSLVVSRLKRMGYRYVLMPSWWDGTRESPQADSTVDYYNDGLGLGGEFRHAVLERYPLIKVGLMRLNRVDMCDALKRQLTYLETVGGDDRPTFTFAHVMAPHNPIVVNAEGRCIDMLDYPLAPRGGTWEEYKRGYSGFVTYLNRRLVEIFDRQKANNPNPLIFVLQADEGPYPKAYRENRDRNREGPHLEWRDATDEQLAMKFGILNALYLGDSAENQGQPAPPDSLTPVNNWRVIFGRLEGRTFPLLPDRYFMVPVNDDPYNSVDITERLNGIAR